MPRLPLPFGVRWKPLVLIGVLCLGATLVGAFAALVRSPGWYAPPVVSPSDRQGVRNNLIAAEQAFTERLRAGDPFTYHIYQSDLNRWIAMRREIYPLIDEFMPPQLIDPFVLFDEGKITIAGAYTAGPVNLVLSIDILLSLQDDELVLRAGALRCGAVRAPMNLGGIRLDTPIERQPGETWPGSPRMSGDLIKGLHVETRAWWKNGGIDYQVRGLRIKPGVLSMDIEPLGRHWARSDQD